MTPRMMPVMDPPRFPGREPIAPQPPDQEHTRVVSDLVLYDGGCGLCHRSVASLARRDRDGSRFVFAPLGGETAGTRLGAGALGQHPAGTVVLLDEGGRLLTKSDAVLRALVRLGGGWRLLSGAARLVPRPLRDGVYLAVARIRGRLFARPRRVCPSLPAHLAGRFLT
jgi:predicted DCC family thiol-disulfide oxidoreductase YuxK